MLQFSQAKPIFQCQGKFILLGTEKLALFGALLKRDEAKRNRGWLNCKVQFKEAKRNRDWLNCKVQRSKKQKDNMIRREKNEKNSDHCSSIR